MHAGDACQSRLYLLVCQSWLVIVAVSEMCSLVVLQILPLDYGYCISQLGHSCFVLIDKLMPAKEFPDTHMLSAYSYCAWSCVIA